MDDSAAEFHYRLPWRTGGRLLGQHASRATGAGYEFRGHARFLDAPDGRRLDLRASLRDPHETLLVRVFDQRSAVTVIVVADVSASMAYAGNRRRLDVLADFTAACARSAWRTGDRFGFVACDQRVRSELYQPPIRMAGTGARLGTALRNLETFPGAPTALCDIMAWVPNRPALIFLVSDFFLPPELLRRALAPLSRHTIVPVVLEDPSEWDPGLRFGLVSLRDPESGDTQTVFWRPALRRRLQRTFETRRTQVAKLFRDLGLRPLWIRGEFDADHVTRYFHG